MILAGLAWALACVSLAVTADRLRNYPFLLAWERALPLVTAVLFGWAAWLTVGGR